jgi:hypothetical protein
MDKSVLKKAVPYTIEEHKHRFAAWAAARAASVKGCRFTVKEVKALLEEAGLRDVLMGGPDKLPAPSAIDRSHEKWRTSILRAAKRRGLGVTHGVAAKLINVYLKAGFVCGGHHAHRRVKTLHPPIDRELLNELSSQNFGNHRTSWNEARQTRWSKLSANQYQALIERIREAMQGRALWRVEQHWRGYQS